MYAVESKERCPACKYNYHIQKSRLGPRHYKFTCPRCSSQWEKKSEPKKPKPAAAPEPAAPDPPVADTPAARREALAGQPPEPKVAPSEGDDRDPALP